MKKLIVFIVLLSAQLVAAQIKVYNETEFETKPYFSGGWNEYASFVEKNFKWINERNSKHIKVDLTVQADGNLTDAKIVDPIGSSNEKEALRIISIMPKWVPATKSGKKVSCRISLGMYNPYANDEDGGMGALTIEADHSPVPDDNQNENLIYNTAGIEVKPEFPGGLQKFYDFFNANFKLPEGEELKGKVFAMFIVEKDGSLSDIKVIRDIGFGTGKEAIRVLKIAPKWIPGKQNGKAVRVLYTLPFAIESTSNSSPEKK